MSFLSLDSASCSADCVLNCIQRATVQQINNVQQEFWGDLINEIAPTQTERKNNIKDILFKSYNRESGKYKFELDSRTFVCESAFLALVGLTSEESRRIPEQWAQLKVLIKQGTSLSLTFIKVLTIIYF